MLATKDAQELWKKLDQLAEKNPLEYTRYMDQLKLESKEFFDTEYPKVTPFRCYSFVINVSACLEKYWSYFERSNCFDEAAKSPFLYVNLCSYEIKSAPSSTSRFKNLKEPNWNIPLDQQVLDLIVSPRVQVLPENKKDLSVDVLAHPMVFDRFERDNQFQLAFEYLIWESLQAELQLQLLRRSCTDVTTADSKYRGEFQWEPIKLLINEMGAENSITGKPPISDLNQLMDQIKISSEKKDDTQEASPQAPTINIPSTATKKAPTSISQPQLEIKTESNNDHFLITIPAMSANDVSLERNYDKLRINKTRIIKIPIDEIDPNIPESVVFVKSKNILRVKYSKRK